MKTITYLCALAFIILVYCDLCNPAPPSKATAISVRRPVVETPDHTESQKKGQELFMAYCASCHNKNMVDPMTGPALKGAKQRGIENGEFDGISGEEWLYRWVKNSQEVVKAWHPYGTALFNEWNKSIMPAHPLSVEEIDNIFDYIEMRSNIDMVVIP